MANRNSPKLHRAYDLVVSALERGDFEGTHFVPSIAFLAQATGVSRFTIWRAMQKLREDGRIRGEPRCRNAVPKTADEVSPQPSESLDKLRQTKHRDLQSRIRRDILNARFTPGARLPAAKALADRYGVAQRTLRKALAELAEEAVLVHRGTHFHASSIAPRTSPAGSRIVLLGHGPSLGFDILWGHWHQECVKFLEFECRKANIVIDLVCFTDDVSGLHLIDGRTGEPWLLKRDPATLGFVYLVTGPQSVNDSLLRRLSGWRLPTAVFDECGLWPTMQQLRERPNVRVFRNTLSDVPARQVARFILELGHRTAVYISAFHNSAYSQGRLAALQEEFSFVEDGEIVAVTDNYDQGQSEQYAARINFYGMFAYYQKWKKNLSYAYTSLMDDHFNALHAKMLEGRQREYLDDLFTRALEVRDATAWIMVNDVCAVYALDFLTHRGMSIPRDLSIISFDDLPDAMVKRVTTYNFNYPGVMQAILRYITDPRHFPSRKPIVEIEGEIIPRRTTGLARP